MFNNRLNTLIQNSYIQAHDNRTLKQSAISNKDEWDEELLPRKDYLKFAVLQLFSGAIDGLIGLGQVAITVASLGKSLEGRMIHHALDSLWQSGHSLRYSFIYFLNIFQPQLNPHLNESPFGIMGSHFLTRIESIANQYCIPNYDEKNVSFGKQTVTRLVYSSMLVAVIAGRVLDALLVVPVLPLALIGIVISLCSKHQFKPLNQVTFQLLEFPTIIYDIVLLSTKIINPNFEVKDVNH